MNLRKIPLKHRLYRLLPSFIPWLHEKRRKGLQRSLAGPEILECQSEQDWLFKEYFLEKCSKGFFWELDCGDGTTGSCTLCLEAQHGWKGVLWEGSSIPRQAASRRRRMPVQGDEPSEKCLLGQASPDLLVLRKPSAHPWIWSQLQDRFIRPGWILIQNPSPDPAWAQRLERENYRLKWFFHDDEYYQRVQV